MSVLLFERPLFMITVEHKFGYSNLFLSFPYRDKYFCDFVLILHKYYFSLGFLFNLKYMLLNNIINDVPEIC